MPNLTNVAEWISSADCVAAFTGAGVSTESGIPDFRSPNGVWAKNDPVYFEQFLASAAARHEYWRQKAESHAGFRDALPNITHTLLADWERSGRLHGVITQNIDGLHQLAGSQIVHELHGTARFIACLTCSARFDADELVKAFQESHSVPDCPECGGYLKHATISFGQQLSEATLKSAFDLAERCDVLLALGSSLQVYPAAGIPQLAKRGGARLVIINRDPTPLDDDADCCIRRPLGDAMAELATLMKAMDSSTGMR